MIPGTDGHAELLQLAFAHTSSSKETILLREILNIGRALPIPVNTFSFRVEGEAERKQCCLEIRTLAEYVLVNYPSKLWEEDMEDLLHSFWRAYHVSNPSHPVFSDHQSNLRKCIPVKLHSDEGTGLRENRDLSVFVGACADE